MKNCKRQSDKKKFILIWNWNRLSFLFSWLLLQSLLLLCHENHYPVTAHFIQIDHNEFRASGFPRPAIPPPLPPIEQFQQHLPAKELTPLEFMVDLTNDLTYRILHYHSILNRNNFAFSPTALMSVLVALYEGSAGRSEQELRNVLQLPNNKDVIRVGYRDIHRRLRTYFFGSENPLKGLSLNRDNVTITRDYETVLMFYGYDLGMDMVSSVATTTPETTTTQSPTTTTAASETTTVSTTAEVTTNLPETEATTQATTTEKQTSKEETTTMPPETTIAETTTTTTTTEKPTTTTVEATTTAPTTTTEEETTTIAAETEANSETETEAETEAPATTEAETEKPENEEAAELVSTFVAEEAEPFLRIEKARVTMLPSGRLQAPLEPKQKSAAMKQKPARVASTTTSTKTTHTKSSPQKQNHASATTTRPSTINQQKSSRLTTATPLTVSTSFSSKKLARLDNVPNSAPGNNYLPATSRTFQSERISIRQARQRRHLIGSFKDNDPNLFVTLFHPQSQPPPHHSLYTISGPGSAPGPLTHITNEFEVEVEPHFITSTGNGGTETKQNYNTDIISHIFYLGNQDVIYTTYKVYNAVLYYKYFEHLKMNVLELELDTPEYNLMILLPDYNTDLVTAAASLRLAPTLRLLRKQLRPRWVQAIIPDFKLHGQMFLTNDLQNLGICDIFEPNRADFRPMTDDKGIYVKHIEQSINVNIRTHPINQLKRNYGAPQLHPIQISVNHPFLFYIIDRDLDVAVMAGRILNPLNVRIQ